MKEAINEIDVAITICDDQWNISYMNKKAIATFENYGGETLLGKNLLDCHSPKSRVMLEDMRAKNESNTYTIEKAGKKKLIHQAPYSIDGKEPGFIEISIELPDEMEHFNRG